MYIISVLIHVFRYFVPFSLQISVEMPEFRCMKSNAWFIMWKVCESCIIISIIIVWHSWVKSNEFLEKKNEKKTARMQSEKKEWKRQTATE